MLLRNGAKRRFLNRSSSEKTPRGGALQVGDESRRRAQRPQRRARPPELQPEGASSLEEILSLPALRVQIINPPGVKSTRAN